MPILKSFLKDHEAESYRNVEVRYVSGRDAKMTIFERVEKTEEEKRKAKEEEMQAKAKGVTYVPLGNWKIRETIMLSEYKTKEEMHALMVEKGFELMSPEEIAEMKSQKAKEAEEETQRRLKKREEAVKFNIERAQRLEKERQEKKEAERKKLEEEQRQQDEEESEERLAAMAAMGGDEL